MTELGAAIADEELPTGEPTNRRPPAPLGRPKAARNRRAVVGWAALGFAGSVLIALAAPRLVTGGVITWWFKLELGPTFATDTAALYLGMGLLAVAWLGLGYTMRTHELRPRQLYLIALIWALPLCLGPPLFSRDVYSYLALGTLAHLGVNPYHHAPSVLGVLGHPHVLDAVSPFWRGTTAPYGPLFLGLSGLIVSVTGASLIAGVVLIRVLELIGLGLVAAFLPRLARALGSDPARAIWLALLSPLVLLQLVSAGHNDALMVGLLIAGVTVALEGRPALGIALCLAAATIKLPAAIGAVFIAAAWARSIPMPAERLRFLGQAGLVGLATLGVLSLLSGLGTSWLSMSAFSTPAKVHLAITPSTALGWTAGSLLRDVGIGIGIHSVESILGVVSAAIVALATLALLWVVRVRTLVWCLAAALLLAAAGGPAAWPWYLIWGVVLLAGLPSIQRSPAVPIALVATAFLIKANGVLVLPLPSAPYVLAGYVVILASAWVFARRRHGLRETGDSEPGLGETGGRELVSEALPRW
jgi:hypothetical protein